MRDRTSTPPQSHTSRETDRNEPTDDLLAARGFIFGVCLGLGLWTLAIGLCVIVAHIT